MKKLIFLFLFATSLNAQSAQSFITIRIEPYTVVNVNYDGVAFLHLPHKTIVDGVEVWVRNNTQNITSLYVKTLELFDSTLIQVKLEPCNIITYGWQWVDINEVCLASEIIGSKKFRATYEIFTPHKDNVERIMRNIVFSLMVTGVK